MSENRRPCDTTGNETPHGRDGPASGDAAVGSSFGNEGGIVPALLKKDESAETDVLRDGVGELAGDAGMASRRWTGSAVGSGCRSGSALGVPASTGRGSAQRASECANSDARCRPSLHGQSSQHH